MNTELTADFVLPSTNGQAQSLTDLRGSYVVLYFYPRDATPGCTSESQDFRDAQSAFAALNAIILGVSRDSMASHLKFKEKQQLNFDLLSDCDEQVCQQYQVIKEKNMYGKQVRGIERSTFLIDPKGVICHAWRKVKVKGHVAEVLAYSESIL